MWISYVGLDHELLDALHEIVDFWYNQLPRHHSLEQGKGRHAAARGLHVPKRPFQQEAQLLCARLPGYTNSSILQLATQPGNVSAPAPSCVCQMHHNLSVEQSAAKQANHRHDSVAFPLLHHQQLNLRALHIWQALG